MDRCILCGKTSEQLSNSNPLTEEHIIPYALGNNSLKLNCLCKECNSKLGDCVDNEFVNSFDMQLARKIYEIKGRNGVPNPFKKGKDYSGHLINVDDNFKPAIVPYTEKNGSSLKIHAPNKTIAKQMVQKSLSRKDFEQAEIDKILLKIDSMESDKKQETISYDVQIDMTLRRIAILKMAYEYTFLKLGETYFDDDRAKEIRDILKAAINGLITDDIINKISVNYLPEDIAKYFDYIKKLEEPMHMIMIQSTKENWVIVIISLFCDKNNSYIVRVSNSSEQYEIPGEPDLIPVKNSLEIGRRIVSFRLSLNT